MTGNDKRRRRRSDRSAPSVPAQVAREFALTKREGQVLRAAARGRSTKEIAFQIGVSGKAIEYFWRRLFDKLGCRSQIEVMALLLRRASVRGTERRHS
jgi:DNA-binding NarL/FixJ family response regulator